jgi:hypothetical protein
MDGINTCGKKLTTWLPQDLLDKASILASEMNNMKLEKISSLKLLIMVLVFIFNYFSPQW